jgi:aspartate carbamoyltransferase catalytic subunit
MRPLRYSINVALDGCCDHREIVPDEDVHRQAVAILDQSDALLFGRVTYEMMEAAWRPSLRTAAMAKWMEPFTRAIAAAKKVRRIEHPGPGRLELGARARGSEESRSAAQVGAG